MPMRINPAMNNSIENQDGKSDFIKDFRFIGGAGIGSTFIKLDLIDEYRFFVNPVVLGRGKPFSKDIHQQLNRRLLKTKAFHSGESSFTTSRTKSNSSKFPTSGYESHNQQRNHPIKGAYFLTTTSFHTLNLPGGHWYFCRKADVKYSMLLKPDEKATSITGSVVFLNSISAFFRRIVSRNWWGEQPVNVLNSRLK